MSAAVLASSKSNNHPFGVRYRDAYAPLNATANSRVFAFANGLDTYAKRGEICTKANGKYVFAAF
jgi:hypothetical protein